MSGHVAWIFVSLCSCATFALEPPSTSKLYRTDYDYKHENDAFYKIHVELKEYDLARDLCRSEGAELMFPSSLPDLMQLHRMFNKYPDLVEWAWIGDEKLPHKPEEKQSQSTPTEINESGEDEDEEQRLEESSSLSERPTLDQHQAISRNTSVIEMSKINILPFICKVKAEDAPFDPHCNVYGKDYYFYNSTGSCYKVSQVAMTWDQALSECQQEGAHLVILNSEAEKDAVTDLIRNVPNKYDWLNEYFAGFRAESPNIGRWFLRVFKTIFNETLEVAGYNQWAEGEPNNKENDEYCGALYKGTGKLNDLDCFYKHSFICEKEIQTEDTARV